MRFVPQTFTHGGRFPRGVLARDCSRRMVRASVSHRTQLPRRGDPGPAQLHHSSPVAAVRLAPTRRSASAQWWIMETSTWNKGFCDGKRPSTTPSTSPGDGFTVGYNFGCSGSRRRSLLRRHLPQFHPPRSGQNRLRATAHHSANQPARGVEMEFPITAVVGVSYRPNKRCGTSGPTWTTPTGAASTK